jgi:hypothetical protein
MSCFQPVRTKQDFYRRWRGMEFGNRNHSFDTIDEVMKCKLPGPFAIRYKIPGSKWMRYHIPKAELRAVADGFVAQGARRELLEFSDMQRDEYIVLQGEAQRDHRGLCLFVSQDKLPMRQALLSAKQYFSPRAERVLEWACDAASVDCIRDLLDQYPGHVVEFSAYSRKVGVIPNRNTLIWEVRAY